MRKILVTLAAIVVFIATVAAGCGTGALCLEDVRWSLTSYGDPDSLKMLLPDTELTARFDSEEKEVTGSGGCNTYFGEYDADSNSLTLTGPLAVTEMWCGDEIGAQESEYLEILMAAEKYEVEDDILLIRCGDHILNFTRE